MSEQKADMLPLKVATPDLKAKGKEQLKEMYERDPDEYVTRTLLSVLGASAGLGQHVVTIRSHADGVKELAEAVKSHDFGQVTALADDMSRYYEHLMEQAHEMAEKLRDLGYYRCTYCGGIGKPYDESGGTERMDCCGVELKQGAMEGANRA